MIPDGMDFKKTFFKHVYQAFNFGVKISVGIAKKIIFVVNDVD